MLLIKNARILMPDGLFLPQGDILTDGGKIVCVDNSIEESNASFLFRPKFFYNFQVPALLSVHGEL